MLWWTVCLVLSTLMGYNTQPVTRSKCSRASGGILSLEVFVEIPVDFMYEYITFLDGSNQEKEATCSTNNVITGAGTSADPFTVKIDVDSNTNPDLSDPDCGHSRTGLNYTWQLSTVTGINVFGGPNNAVTQPILCDFSQISENPGTVLEVGDTTNLTTIVLTHTSTALEMGLAKDDFSPYLQTETKTLGDIVRLSITALGPSTALYMYSCQACDTALCDNVVFQLLDQNGCENDNFDVILAAGNMSSPEGSFMRTGEAGKAFTRGFRLFRFAASNVVFMRCNIGYCNDPSELLCADRCAANVRRKRQTSSDKEWVTYFINVEGADSSMIVGSPKTMYYTNSTSSRLEAMPCLEKVEFIVVLSTLCTAVVSSGAMVAYLKRKLSNH